MREEIVNTLRDELFQEVQWFREHVADAGANLDYRRGKFDAYRDALQMLDNAIHRDHPPRDEE